MSCSAEQNENIHCTYLEKTSQMSTYLACLSTINEDIPLFNHLRIKLQYVFASKRGVILTSNILH